MKNRILIVCLSLLSVVSVIFLYHFRVEADSRIEQPPSEAPFSHELFDQVLQEYVDGKGRVNYTKLKANPEKLEAYLDLLAVANPTELSYNGQLVFWVNAYNALVIKGVIDHYPTTSVRKVKWFNGFFSRLKFRVAGKTYTLNQIEHDIIRTEFVDPRVHFILVCASRSCPPLEKRAFSVADIEERLETATFNFIQDPTKVRLDRAKRHVYLSKIFKWYDEDFREGYDGVADFLADYLPPEDADFVLAEDVKFQHLDYDWTLNDQNLPQAEF
ncbi:DUF547 domain-containing protein [Candidatus Poribacteria bacterium]|nr:DUF547 domain-containing protein [Candidatus Poribacteria bacterium]